MQTATHQRPLCALRRLGCYLNLLLAGPAATQPLFTETTEVSAVPADFASRSSAFGDYNNDGRPDLFLTENYGDRRVLLLSNEGEGRFADQTHLIQEHIPPNTKGGGSIFGDYDNDGDLDLFVAIGGPDSGQRNFNVLLRNDQGAFADVTQEANLTNSLPTDSALWLDYDRDGYIDLYTGNMAMFDVDDPIESPGDPAVRNKLYRNSGQGTFADVTGEAGLDVQLHSRWGGTSGGVASGDFNDDGWPDLYLGVFLQRNRLFLNDGQGGFQDATTDEIGDVGQAKGAATGDIDNDLDLDILQAAGGGAATSTGDTPGERSPMLLNLGAGQFLDVAEGVGLDLREESRIPSLVDMDNDGDLDLLVIERGDFRFFLNDGEGFFAEETALSGEQGALYLSWGDYNLDGFLDMWTGGDSFNPPGLIRNQGNNNHWLRVELAGVESNRRGLGARLIATAGDLQQMREIVGGDGFVQSEQVAHFGLGAHAQVDRLEIHWPSGQVDELIAIPADQKIRVFEGRQQYHVVQPTVWTSPPPGFVLVGSTFDFKAALRPALFEAGAKITRVTADLSAIGGSAAAPLEHRGDGVYALETGVSVTSPDGPRMVSVLIEQNTSLGAHWTHLSRSLLAVLSDEDRVLFADAPAMDWKLEPDLGLELNPGTRAQVYGGEAALELRAAGAWKMDYVPAAPVSAVGYRSLRFAFHPGAATLPAPQENVKAITFMSNRDGNWEIYAMAADGSNQVNLTNDPADDRNPDWSPDGTKIALHALRNGKWEIWVVDADGDNLTQVTDNEATDWRPDWSPDGTKIAFESDRSGTGEIWVMEADGSNPVQVTQDLGTDGRPSWSPDGTKIAFDAIPEGVFQVSVMEADGSNPILLTDNTSNSGRTSWSSDGTKIAFISDRAGDPADIYSMAADGSNPVNLTNNPAIEFHPDWVPVGGTAGALGFAVAINSNVVRLSGADLAVLGVDIERQEWQVIEVPLRAFNLSGPIESIQFRGNLQGVFYLDDISLVSIASPTAVLEERTADLPQHFALQQNYPNPFNSTTVIRFALPASGAVELAIYNLAGQKVTTLVEGTRTAGAYTLHWDGRDARGRELASGVYLYQLRAGTQVETRKLLLLR
jgi:hypothetical protein